MSRLSWTGHLKAFGDLKFAMWYLGSMISSFTMLKPRPSYFFRLLLLRAQRRVKKGEIGEGIHVPGSHRIEGRDILVEKGEYLEANPSDEILSIVYDLIADPIPEVARIPFHVSCKTDQRCLYLEHRRTSFALQVLVTSDRPLIPGIEAASGMTLSRVRMRPGTVPYRPVPEERGFGTRPRRLKDEGAELPLPVDLHIFAIIPRLTPSNIGLLEKDVHKPVSFSLVPVRRR